MIDAPATALNRVKEILAEHAPDCDVWVFGSRATGNAARYSDLDLALMGEEQIERRRLNLLELAFENSDLPFRVDILDWRRLSPEFQSVIAKDRVLLQSANR